VGLTGKTLTASRGVKLVADAEWADIVPNTFDVLILPGGREGTRVLCADARSRN